MNILVHEPLAKRVTFDENNMWVELADGRKLVQCPLSPATLFGNLK